MGSISRTRHVSRAGYLSDGHINTRAYFYNDQELLLHQYYYERQCSPGNPAGPLSTPLQLQQLLKSTALQGALLSMIVLYRHIFM